MALYGQNPYGSSSPWFSNQNNYGNPWGDPNAFLQTPLGRVGANQQDAAYYQRLISPFAGGNDAFSRFVQGQQGRFLSGLDQARLTSPDLNIIDYANPNVNFEQFAKQWRGMGLGARGQEWAKYAPRTRIMGY